MPANTPNDQLGERGLFADASNFDQRYIPDYEQITQIVNALRVLGQRVVLTMGTFDILHEGHSMYLEAARGYGDFLIVGVDSDEKVRQRKGIWRPAVPELERLRMVTHQRGVSVVTLKHVRARTLGPHSAPSHRTCWLRRRKRYKPDEIEELEAKYCGRVEVLDRMATVSTTARLRLLQLELGERMSAHLAGHPNFPELTTLLQEAIDEIGGPR